MIYQFLYFLSILYVNYTTIQIQLQNLCSYLIPTVTYFENTNKGESVVKPGFNHFLKFIKEILTLA